MIYAKCKDTFKKKTISIEHKNASKHLIQAIRNKMKEQISSLQNIDASNSTPNLQELNHQQHTQLQHRHQQLQSSSKAQRLHSIDKTNPLQTNINPSESLGHSLKAEQKLKKITQNLQEKTYTPLNSSIRKVTLSISNIYDLTVQNLNKDLLNNAHKVYIQLLQQKNSQQSQKIGQLDEQIVLGRKEINQLKIKISKLLNYYNKGKNCLISTSMELIQCKNDLNQHSERYQYRIHSINQTLGKNQRIIETYGTIINTNFNQQQPNKHIASVTDPKQTAQKIDIFTITTKLEEYQAVMQYQQKTIKHLKQMLGNQATPINELKLLRYQINRISQQNQKYKKQQTKNLNYTSKFQSVQPISPAKLSLQHAETSNWNKHYYSHTKIQSHSQNKRQLDGQKVGLKKKSSNIYFRDRFRISSEVCQHITAESDDQRVKKLEQQCYKLKEEKDFLIDMYEQQKQEATQMEKILQQLNKKDPNNKASIKNESKHSNSGSNTIQDLVKFLCDLPNREYHNILINMIQKYEYKISEINEAYSEEKCLRDKLQNWNAEVYKRLLQYSECQCNYQENKSKHPQKRLNQIQTILNLKQQYQSIIARVQTNCIDNYLRQIKCLSLGIDEKQINDMAQELKQYVITLRARLPVLKEVYFQDGSSVSESQISSIEVNQE